MLYLEISYNKNDFMLMWLDLSNAFLQFQPKPGEKPIPGMILQ